MDSSSELFEVIPSSAPVKTHAAARSKSPSARPVQDKLSDFDDRAQVLGRRLGDELRLLIARVPDDARTIRGLASHLGIDPSICQRTIHAAKPTDNPRQVLARLPGVEGLRLLAEAARARKETREIAQNLLIATDRFAELVEEAGGSHAKLRTRLDEVEDRSSSQQALSLETDAKNLRRELYKNTCAILGTSLEAHHLITILRRVPGHPSLIYNTMLRAYVGYKARAGAEPMVVTTYTPRPDGPEKFPDGHPQPINELVESLSTTPSPIVSAKTSEGSILQVIDPVRAGTDPLDVVMLSRHPAFPHPRFDNIKDKTANMMVMTRVPSAALVLDLYIEREMLAECVSSTALAWTSPELYSTGLVHWQDRLPGAPKLELIGSDASTESWPHHVRATDILLESAQVRRSGLIGFRAEVRFPVWGPAYCMLLDFAEPPATVE